jgi:hypothetical protein
VTDRERIVELERSHDELRGALIAAARHIKKFRHTPENAKLLFLLRRTFRDERAVRRGGPKAAVTGAYQAVSLSH